MGPAGIHGTESRRAGKIGGTELKLINRYLSRRDGSGICHDFGRHAAYAAVGPGIYPNDASSLSKFSQIFLDALGDVTHLGVWYRYGEASVTSGGCDPLCTLGVRPVCTAGESVG
jgi:hypothetical protein